VEGLLHKAAFEGIPMPAEPGPLPTPAITSALPIHGAAVVRPDPSVVLALTAVSSATATAELHRMGVRQTFIQGPVTRRPGTRVVGPAVTLQFMPQRDDIANGLAQEKAEKATALPAVFETVQPGDILVVQAFGDPNTGCMGDMLITYFVGRGGAGIVVDGCIRDWPHVRAELDVPLWTRGVTPNHALQAGLFPWAYNVPVACGGALVIPGDIIIADDDGVVVVPVELAPMLLERALEHEDWEVFSRLRLAEGGSLRRYYPLDDEGLLEYETWRKEQGR
jgi:regulator of RNase E activity RraA